MNKPTEKTSRAIDVKDVPRPAASEPREPRAPRVKTGIKAGFLDDPHGA